MRLGIGEPNWRDRYAGRVKCYCNGKEVKGVSLADEERGFVRRLWRSETGGAYCDPVTEEFATVDVYGDVRIEFDSPWIDPRNPVGKIRALLDI